MLKIFIYGVEVAGINNYKSLLWYSLLFSSIFNGIKLDLLLEARLKKFNRFKSNRIINNSNVVHGPLTIYMYNHAYSRYRVMYKEFYNSLILFFSSKFEYRSWLMFEPILT